MNKLEQLYEGKAKKVFATEDPNLVTQATAPRRAPSAARAL